MAASLFISFVFCKTSVKITETIPAITAPINGMLEDKVLLIKNPNTIPIMIEWLIASPIKDILLKTRNTPQRAHDAETIIAINIISIFI